MEFSYEIIVVSWMLECLLGKGLILLSEGELSKVDVDSYGFAMGCLMVKSWSLILLIPFLRTRKGGSSFLSLLYLFLRSSLVRGINNAHRFKLVLFLEHLNDLFDTLLGLFMDCDHLHSLLLLKSLYLRLDGL